MTMLAWIKKPTVPVGSLLFLFVLWFGSYAYEVAFAETGLKPLYSYFVLVGFGVMYVMMSQASGRQHLKPYGKYFYAFYAWFATYLAYAILEFLLSTQDVVAVQAFINVGEAVALSSVFVLMMAEPRMLRLVGPGFAILAIFGSMMDLLDFVHPMFSSVPGRAAGLYVNPNIAGNFIAMAMVAGIGAVPRRLKTGFLVACGVGVLVTFSRESWILWGVGVIWLGWSGELGKSSRRRQIRRLLAIAAAATLGAGFIALLFTGKVGELVSGTAMENYLTPNTIGRLSMGAAVESGSTAELRMEMVKYSLEQGAEAPWLGHGLGYTQEWRYPIGPHNMYLLFFVEGGVFGLTLYTALILLLWLAGTGVGRVVAIQIIVSSLFSHNHLEQPAILMMIAFVVAHGVVTRDAGTAPARIPPLRGIARTA